MITHPARFIFKAIQLLGAIGMTALVSLAEAPAEERTRRTDWSDERLLTYAKEIHAKYLTRDTHLDVSIVLRRPGFDITQEHSWPEHASEVDFPRMVKGGLDGGLLSCSSVRGH